MKRDITPYLQVINTADAISWCKRVLRIKEVRERLVTPDGTCMNAEIEGTRIMLADEMSKIGSTSPATLTGTSVVLNLHVGGFPATPGDTGGDTFVAVSGSAELLQATGRGGVGSPVIASGTGGTVSSAGTSDGVAGNTGRRRETAPIMP